ncbi:putative ribonuclease H-like domain-containing protein [Tanacetum coccineum]
MEQVKMCRDTQSLTRRWGSTKTIFASRDLVCRDIYLEVVDSGFSRHTTGNISYLLEYGPFNGGYVSFGYGRGKITGKGSIKTCKLDFKNVYFVEELKYNLFSVSQNFDNKNSVLFTDFECIVLGKDFKLVDDKHVLLRTPRQENMYSINLKNIIPHKNLTCLIAKASEDESMLWHRRLGHLNFKTMNKLVRNNLVKGLPSKSFENNHTCVACLKRKQHKASCKSKLVNYVSKPLHTLHMELFGPTSVNSLNHKWILRNFITEIENLKDLKVKIIRCDNGAERRNRTLIKAARTMLADAKLPVTFWAEAINTTCYVQNRVLVIKPHNKTPYELFNERSSAIGFLRPFGCHVMILNTLDHLGKFDAKGDEGTSSTIILGTKEDANQAVKENVSSLRFIALLNWIISDTDVSESSRNTNPTASTKDLRADQVERVLSSIVETEVLTVSSPIPTNCLCGPRIISMGGSSYQEAPSLGNAMSFKNRLEDFFGDTTDLASLDKVEADLSNMETDIEISPTPTIRIHKVHPKKEPKKIFDALKNPSWVDAMQEYLIQFKIQNVWVLVDCPKGVRPIGIKWVLKNKRDERGIVIRNMARLVAQGYTQEEGIDYEEVFAPVARIEAIRLFLPYASYMGFTVYQMDVKSAFLYGTIDEKVYVMQPPGFQDSEFPDRVYKVEKAMYGLHQAPRTWYGTLSKYSLDNGFQRGTIDQTQFIRKHKGEFLLIQVYVDDIIFGSSNLKLCREFEARMHDKFKMSAMGELNFFLVLQVLQKKDGIFLSQDKYVVDILKKFGFSDIRSANTPMDRENPWRKDGTGKDVELHLYRSLIGSLMYLTASRPDIMFAVCACARHQVIPKECHLYAVKRIFRYLKGYPKLGLWYPKESPFDLVAYSNSDYGGATQDRKSTTRGCQFLGRRLISWQCKKQTIVATSIIEAEYVAAASGYGQVLWIQN